MGIQQISGAAAPLTAADVRAHCSIAADDATFDNLLADYIAGANNLIEEMVGRSFGAQVWELSLDAFLAEIELPRGPVTGVTSVKYYDAAGVQQTLDPSLYLVDMVSDPARLVPAPDTSWPTTQSRVNAVTVRFASGYVAVPPMILQCIRTTVAAWFASHEAVALPQGVIDALAAWRSQWVFA